MSAKRHRSKKYYRFRMENFMSKELHYNNPIVLQRADPYVLPTVIITLPVPFRHMTALN